MKVCHACGAPWDEKHEPGRNEECLSCGADMYCCLNCKFYDPMRSGQCALPNTEPPSDKVAANSCEEFMMGSRPAAGPAYEERKKALKEKWDSLFKG